MIRIDGGVCQLSEWGTRWFESGDDEILIALLHSHYRFVGEMLGEALVPRTADEMLTIVNDRYGLGWSGNQNSRGKRSFGGSSVSR